ncbi:helix-turn-helix domain-containing protein [Nocardioides sp. TF02-7]|uniref:helix-turn-helix domain-containing protein n=1 Tax=Nocardioides sp. TF02-7 TaxID=2917724 RepID=UPI001F066AB0|nr:helix-turn-helix domain-containing protein [Nocardioides sp. TF02-7]UMG94152.1 helix-turn-helix domain-containing protein [Nocardioides sp. TF02-7]
MTATAPETERPDLLTANDVAAYLRVPLHTVYRLHRSGRLRGMPVTAKNLRWRRADVDAYLSALAAH